MTYSVTGKYSWNAVCDVCQAYFKASQLRLRWDGLMTCSEDWEPRHPSDFYRTRNDAHQLPWTRPDAGPNPNLSFLPAWTGLTSSTNVTTPAIDYHDDTFNSLRTLVGTIVVPRGDTCSGTASAITLPSSPVTAGTFMLMGTYGKILLTGAIPAGSTALTVGNFTTQNDTILFSGRYGI